MAVVVGEALGFAYRVGRVRRRKPVDIYKATLGTENRARGQVGTYRFVSGDVHGFHRDCALGELSKQSRWASSVIPPNGLRAGPQAKPGMRWSGCRLGDAEEEGFGISGFPARA